ncbi:MAG: thermonuclease family protein [Planctomycetota bacterium]|nr:thermonuclease family protein [Planctomycetota bacterium]
MAGAVLWGAVLALPGLGAADAPDGTTFDQTVIAVDGPGQVRIKFCGMPVKVQLANLQFKGGEPTEQKAQAFLKETLPAGTKIKLVMESGKEGDGTGLPQAHLFKGTSHVNLEMVKRGFAISDGGSQKYAQGMQTAQMDAMTKKAGLWAQDVQVASKPEPKPESKPETRPTAPEARPAAPEMDVAPADYAGAVVADLQGKEYHLPGSRYAKSIRQGARIEYPNPEAAERAGKSPSPFSFPDRAKAAAAKVAAAKGGQTPDQIVQESQNALKDALTAMQEARKFHGTDHKRANSNWQKAAKILGESLDKLTPVADANPNNATIQKLAEEMSMNLYSCNKYQSL